MIEQTIKWTLSKVMAFLIALMAFGFDCAVLVRNWGAEGFEPKASTLLACLVTICVLVTGKQVTDLGKQGVDALKAKNGGAQ